MQNTKWGWTRYERTHWKRDGRKAYIGYFKKNNDPYNWTTQRIQFWAQQPIIALRFICNSGKHPKEFDGKEVN